MTEYIDGHRWPTTAVAPAERPASATPDQVALAGAPDSISCLLRQPGVYVQADETRCQVVIGLPADLARAIAAHAPNPLQVRLAAQLVDGALADLQETT